MPEHQTTDGVPLKNESIFTQNGTADRRRGIGMKNNSSLIHLAFIALLLMSGCSNGAVDGCVEVTVGSVKLSVPKQQRISPFGNFTFVFDSHVPGVDCPLGCDDLFVNISSTTSTLEQLWKYLDPEFTGRMSGAYRVYLDRFDRASSKPLREILVQTDTTRSHDEFYRCDLEDRENNPGCNIRIITKSGLTAEFSIRRKALSKAREAASFVTQSIDQFAENHTKGICK